MNREESMFVKYMEGETLDAIGDAESMTKEGARRCIMKVVDKLTELEPSLPGDLRSLRIVKDKAYEVLSIASPKQSQNNEMSFYELLGDQLVLFRKKANLTQTQIAIRLGYTQKAWSKYELGKAKIALLTLMQFCKECECEIGQVVSDLPLNIK